MPLCSQDILAWISILCFFLAQATNAQIKIDGFTCGNNQGTVRRALEEAMSMADFAYQRQTALERGTLNVADQRTTLLLLQLTGRGFRQVTDHNLGN